MEKDGNYQVVFGLELDEVPKGDLKVMINGHGDFNKIGDRSIEEIAEHIGTINLFLREVSCCLFHSFSAIRPSSYHTQSSAYFGTIYALFL
jgi:hypothetical protein